ncbi:MAG: hypothetical protein WD712_03140 [Candidatus Spechtbacterales bacterium]
MGILNLLPARIILLALILLILLFVLPEGIINEIPGAQWTKSYLEKTFSQMWNTANNIWNKLVSWLDNAAAVVRDSFNRTQATVQLLVKEKVQALEDILKAVDAINRLFNTDNTDNTDTK